MNDKINKDMKNSKVLKVYNGIKILVFFIILFLLVGIAGKVVERKGSIKKYADFWELSEQIDVLFFGSSHMLDSINPLLLYEEYGITSYNMGKTGGIMPESYWTMMNALDYCQPKCVVVDLWALDRDYQYIDLMESFRTDKDRKHSVSFFHDNMDSFPLSITKVKAVNDLISNYDTKKEFFWNLYAYHSRWSSLDMEDFQALAGKKIRKEYLGSTPEYIMNPDFHFYRSPQIEEALPYNTVCVQYLYKIVEECKKRNIEVILTFMPTASAYEQDWLVVNTGEMIADELGLLFLNLLPQDTYNLIDYELDMFDEGHTNISGMRKVTSFIGKYLCEVDGIVDHRMDPNYQTWEKLVNEWKEEDAERLLGEKDLYLELSMINDLKANSIIFLPGNSSSLQDDIIQKLIMRLAGSSLVLEAAEQGGPYIMIRDGSSGTMQVQEFVGEQQIDSFESILGDTLYIGLKNFGAIYANGDLENNYLNMEEHYETQVQILILGQDGEVMAKLYYDPVWNDMKQGQ